MFKKNNAKKQETILHEQNFMKLCQLCSPNFTKEEILADTIDWDAIWKLAIRHRVVPVMADRMKQLGIQAPEDTQKRIDQNVQKNLFKGMKQAAEIVKITQLFEKHGIRFVVFKGIALLKLMNQELHQRHHGDIDILLADFGEVKKADTSLLNAGYIRKRPAEIQILSSKQEKHIRRFEKDVTYYHPLKKILIEVHFKLCISTKLFPLSAERIFNNRDHIKINSCNIPIMRLEDYYMYLLVHGSVSLWFRLKWLCDIPLISNNGIIFGQTDFQKKTSSLGIERMTTQGIFLANNMLSMPCSHEVLQHYENDKQVHFISAIAKRNLATYNLDLGLFEKSKYLFLFAIKYMPVLRKDYSYKVNHVRSYLTRTTDWEVLALPDYLFFLYYPLRPFLWLKRQL